MTVHTFADEEAFIESEKKRFPELFFQKTNIDDGSFLEKFGIFIPESKFLPLGQIKLLPSDFIVEEVLQDGTVCTIDEVSVEGDILPVTDGPYTTYATLVKCGLSTLQVIDILITSLGCTKEQIQYGGIKDRNAITSQRLSFRNIPPQLLRGINHPQFFFKDITVGKGVTSKGNIKGNRFTILIRLKPDTLVHLGDDGHFVRRLQEVATNGFYNYYYLQRFAAPRYINIYWATKILQGDYREAVRSFLGDPGLREEPYFQELRKKINNSFGQWEVIQQYLQPFPIMLSSEWKLVQYLQKHPNDFSGALASIQDHVVLWIYAMSSLLFNEKLSSYLKERLTLPNKFPLFLSNSNDDVALYKMRLIEMGFSNDLFTHLKPFPFIRRNHTEVETRVKFDLHGAEIVSEGIILSFTLGVGGYATTLLSHLFTLMTDFPSDGISKVVVDTVAPLGRASVEPLLKRFGVK